MIKNMMRFWMLLILLAFTSGCSPESEMVEFQPTQVVEQTQLPTLSQTPLPNATLTLLPTIERQIDTATPSEMAVVQPRELIIFSLLIQPGGGILPQFTCTGGDSSPPLNWDWAPAETKSLALIVEDVDAPGGIFVHWVLFNIPADRKYLPQDVPGDETVEGIGVQGVNDARKTGYTGPCPPPGSPHRYFFRLYALDTRLFLPAGTQKSDLEKGMEGHILAQAEFFATYQSQAQNSNE